MRSHLRMVLSVFALLSYILVDGCSTHGFESEKTGEDAKGVTDPGTDYGGDPVIFVNNPSEVDPSNKYIPYKGARIAPKGEWVANKLGTKRSDPTTIASRGDAPTNATTITIKTDRDVSDQISSRERMMSAPSIDQVSRNDYTDTFTQTGAEATQTKLTRYARTFAAKQAGLLDILLVIDTSGSMLQEVRAMAAALPKLLGRSGSYTNSRYVHDASYYLHRTDWRIGLVASSPEDGCEILGVMSAEGSTFDYPLPARDEQHPDTENMLWREYKNDYWPLDGARAGQTTDSLRYYSGDKRHNPFLKTFMQHFTPGANADTNPGSEHLLKKVRWALEGKSGTRCDGRWIRDNASVAVIVATDEGHQCPSTEEATCSIHNFIAFRDGFSHNLKVYGQLAKSKWTADEQQVFAKTYEASGTRSAASFGHSSFYSFGQDMLNDPDFLPSYIYSPLDPHPNADSVAVKIKQYSTAGLINVGKCSNSLTASCYKELPSTQSWGKGAVQLVEYGHFPNRNIHYNRMNSRHAMLDGRSVVTVEWESGGNTVGGQPFVSSFDLTNDPLPDVASMTVTVIKKDNSKTPLDRGTDYTLNGRTISIVGDIKQVVPAGSRLKIDYKQNVALQTSFNIGSANQLPAGATLVSGSARIDIIDSNSNTRANLSSGFSFNGDRVVFDSLSIAPAEGESFQLSYRYTQQVTTQVVRETIITDYTYTKRSNTDTNRDLACQSGGSSITCTYTAPVSVGAAGTISFSGNSLSKGDEVMVTEYLQRSGSGVSINGNVTLAGVGLSDCDMNEAIEMRLGATVCSSLGAQSDDEHLPVTSSGTIELLSANDCSIVSDILNEDESHSAQVVFQCKALEELPDDFLQMRKDFFAMHRGKYKFEYWQIVVDGQELQLSDSTDLVIEDYRITEIKGVDTSDADAMRELLGGNDKTIKVVVRLYEAL